MWRVNWRFKLGPLSIIHVCITNLSCASVQYLVYELHIFKPLFLVWREKLASKETETGDVRLSFDSLEHKVRVNSGSYRPLSRYWCSGKGWPDTKTKHTTGKSKPKLVSGPIIRDIQFSNWWCFAILWRMTLTNLVCSFYWCVLFLCLAKLYRSCPSHDKGLSPTRQSVQMFEAFDQTSVLPPQVIHVKLGGTVSIQWL